VEFLWLRARHVFVTESRERNAHAKQRAREFEVLAPQPQWNITHLESPLREIPQL
jgi:hypothetical protein